MWFWEVIFEVADGGRHSLFSTVGFEEIMSAYDYFLACEDNIDRELHKRGYTKIIDIHIVYKSSGNLYQDGRAL